MGHLRRIGFFFAAASAAALTGCSCAATPSAPCADTSDCAPGQQCQSGMCLDVGQDGGTDAYTPGCVDNDRDGFGQGCAAGPDCDDTDALRGGPEMCDGVDNDCDGEVDEGLKELCADCVPACQVTKKPAKTTGDNWNPTDDNASSVIVDDNGTPNDPTDDAITLDRTARRSFAVWVANTNEDTVSKIDTRTGDEIARYPSVRPTMQNGLSWNIDGSAGNRPSRTAVDQNFDSYVANRAFNIQGSVTKYAYQQSDCVDWNNDGLHTSTDVNGDGRIDLGDPQEFIGPDDDCLLWTRNVGGTNGVPRALAVGVAPADEDIGDVWVGLNGAREMCRMDGTTGDEIACLDADNGKPYGAAADGAGRIWFVDRQGGGQSSRRPLLYVDPLTGGVTRIKAMPGSGGTKPYGMTVDGEGRVFLVLSNQEQVWRYTPDTDAWDHLDIPTPNGLNGSNPRGIAADETSLWVANSNNEPEKWSSQWSRRVEQFDLDTLLPVKTHMLPPDAEGPVGVGISFDGSVWAIAQKGEKAARLDPNTGTWSTTPVGKKPYTYSDFIGFGLNRFAQPRGEYRVLIEGCSGGSNRWQGARYVADLPPDTRVELHARVSAEMEQLDDEPWIGPFVGSEHATGSNEYLVSFLDSPGPLGTSAYLQIEIRLRTNSDTVVPRVFDLDVAGVCVPDPI